MIITTNNYKVAKKVTKTCDASRMHLYRFNFRKYMVYVNMQHKRLNIKYKRLNIKHKRLLF